MDKRDYRELFDSLAPRDALLRRTEREADRMMSRKAPRRVVRTTVIVILVILATVGVALAVTFHSRILDSIFPKDEPSMAALNALQTDVASVSGDGLTLTVDELLMDENSLSCTWTVTSSRAEDVYYLTYYDLDDESAFDGYGENTSKDVGDMTLVRLTPEENSYSGNLRMFYETPRNETPRMTIRIYAFTTGLIPVKIENSSGVIHADEGDPLVVELESKGEIACDGERLSSIWAYGAVQRAYEALVSGDADDEVAEVGAFAKSGLMEEVTAISLTVPQDSDGTAPEAAFRLDAPQTFRLSDRTVVVNQLNLDAASTTIQYDIYPDELPEARNLLIGYRYLLFDQDGKLLDVDHSLGLDMSANLEYDENAGVWKLDEGAEKPKLSVTVSGNPLPEGLTFIRFVPTCELERRKGESANTYYGRMAALADEAGTFIVELP